MSIIIALYIRFDMKDRPSTFPRAHGFSLIELLVVLAIIAILAVLTLPALNSFSSAGFDSSVSNLDGVLQQARTFAMARNSYVYVGLTEVDATKTAPTAGIGRVVVAVISTNDGTSGFDSNSSSSPIWTSYSNGSGFSAVAPVRLFSNVHLVDLGTPPATGGMARPTVSAAYRLGNAACISVTPIAWPLGTALGAGQYNFTMVIQYSPQGTVRVVLSGSGGSIPQQIEIGLQPTHENVLPPASATNQAAIQIDGITGIDHVYRP